MRKFLLALVAILTLTICVVFGLIAYRLISSTELAQSVPPPATADSIAQARPTSRSKISQPTIAVTTASRTPTLAPVIPKNLPAPDTLGSSSGTLDTLTALNPPPNDRIRLAQEFKGITASLATPVAPKRYNVGDKEMFWVNRDMQNDNQKITATLRYKNDVVYMWVEDGERVDDAALRKSADVFASKIYPTNRQFLGSEANPGVDNDPRLHILNARFQNAAGYFSQSDTLPVQVNRHSNGKEMFYINTRALRAGDDLYDSVLAHEFAHMIHRNQNERGEASWITEGFGDLGIELNGYQTGHEQAFAENPDLQLNAWDALPGLSVPHYGAAYLFISYQLNRFGDDYIRDVFSSNLIGIPSIQRALDRYANGLTFDQIFADWIVANFINDNSQGARYGYLPSELGIRPTMGYAKYPAQGSDTVHQYGTDYIQLLPDDKDVTFTFDGADTVRAIPTDPHSGQAMWWSGRTDMSDTTLERPVDLSKTNKATLKFWTWYSLEDNYDYAYVSVSTDGGRTWRPLQGNTTTNRDPNATNYGNGLNCKSGVGCGKPDEAPQWIQEEMDLTPYGGQKILLRFEQVTDEVYAAPGLAIDDIEIPEIGFQDDAESGDNGWQAAGFARIDNVLPQRFIVQAIEFGTTPRVVQIPLDAQNRGTYKTQGLGQVISRVVITVSGSTPVTWESAEYEYEIQ